MSLSKNLLACSSLAIVCVAGSASAQSIKLTNTGFETLPASGLPISCASVGAPTCAFSKTSAHSDSTTIPGWTFQRPGGAVAYGGQFAPDGRYFTTIPSNILGYSTGGRLIQTVGVTAAADTTYTLTFDMGFRTGDTFANNSFGELLIGDTGVYAKCVERVGGGACGNTASRQGSGNWYVYTATFTTGGADVGDAMVIKLSDVRGGQGDWDNVSLTSAPASLPESRPTAVSPVPEPAAWALMLVGVAGVGGLTRLRRRSGLEAASLA